MMKFNIVVIIEKEEYVNKLSNYIKRQNEKIKVIETHEFRYRLKMICQFE